MKGVVLAAGKGTRLYPITRRIPKPLLPIANRVTLEYAFDRLKEIGVFEVCVVVGENEREMRAGLGDGATFGIDLSYARQVEPKGLAHAVSFARDFVGEDDFVLYLGDAVYSESLGPHAGRFRTSGAASLNLVKPVADPSRFGVASVDGERIVRLVEKPPAPESNLAMAGVYFFGPSIWKVLPDLPPSARGEFEITDAIQRLVDRDEPVLAGVFEGEWFDTGTLDSFLATSRFLTRNGRMFGRQVEVEGDAGKHLVVGDAAVLECGEIEDAVILPGADVRVRGAIRHSILAGVVREDGNLENCVVDGSECVVYRCARELSRYRPDSD